MQKVATAATVAATVVALLVGSVAPAFADVDPIPGNSGAGISVSVSHSDGGAGGSSGGAPVCTYQKANVPGDPTSELVNPLPPPSPGARGAWFLYQCNDPAASFGTRSGTLWVPANQPAVPPAVLAQQASKWLPLPVPGIQTSPATDVNQVVNIPTWLWVTPATWGQRSATASVPNESATVTATPVSVTWTMGDGSQVVCHSPGTPFRASDPPGAASPDCGHTYQRSSAGQPSQRYPVSATTRWRIAWTATGVVNTSGTLPDLLRSSTTSLRVAEVQTIN